MTNKKNTKITVVGMGYVGLSNAVMLSQYFEVSVYDIVEEKRNKVKNKVCPFADKEIDSFLKNKQLNLNVLDNLEDSYMNTTIYIIAVPTNYDESKNYFDTSKLEEVISKIIKYASSSITVIKSTIPMKFTEKQNTMYNTDSILYSPEFLREGRALHDNLNPSRIVIGGNQFYAEEYKEVLCKCYCDITPQIFLTGSFEAEAIKLFSNTYLAMRVAFFNELDSFAEINNLKAVDIIKGVCSDQRIGRFYNNPSFGYGGYCLPKDTKQLNADMTGMPHRLIGSINQSNEERKQFIVERVLERKPKAVGIYRLIMKADSDNFRNSAIFEVIEELKKLGVSILVYEPNIIEIQNNDFVIEHDIHLFKKKSDIIIANRINNQLLDVLDKVYTRDIFSND